MGIPRAFGCIRMQVVFFVVTNSFELLTVLELEITTQAL